MALWYLPDTAACSNCNDIYKEMRSLSCWNCFIQYNILFLNIRKSRVYDVSMHWLSCVQNWFRVHHACSPQMMIIAACLSHTSATISLTVLHLTRQLSSRQRDWQGHNEPWQSAPAWFVQRENARAFVWFGRAVCAGRSRCTGSRGARPGRNQTESFGAAALPSYRAEHN